MNPRTGPQGTTMDDLRRVTGTVAPLRTTRSMAPRMPRMLPTEQIVSNIVGGPLPTYGQKYGGYPTAEQFQQAIIGSLDPFVYARELASAQAEQNRAALSAQATFQPRTPQDYDRLRAEEEAVRAMLAQPLSPSLPAQMDRRAELAAREMSIGDVQRQLAGVPGFMAGAGQKAEGLREDIRVLRRNVPSVMSEATRALAEQKAADEARAEAYARNMERMNLVAMAQPSPETYGQTGGRPVSMRDIAARRLGTPVTVAQAAEQAAAEQAAQDLARLNVSDLAQRLATERYGVDPALASGMFGPEFAREFGVRQLGEQGVFPDQSIEEYIGLTQGPDALATYQQDRVQAALQKQTEGFRTAEEEAFDLNLEQQTGLNVDAVAGNRSRAIARGYLQDPTFIQRVNAEVSNLVANPALNLEQQRNQARIAATEFFAETGDPVAAELFLNALLSFDFTLAYSAG